MPSAKRRLVGLLLSPHTGPHLAESVAWFQEAAWALDYDVLTYSIRNQKQQAMPCLRMLSERRVDAIASLILDPDPDLMEALSNADVPVVCFEGIHTIRGGASLSIDYRHGIREGVQHLALLGSLPAFAQGDRLHAKEQLVDRNRRVIFKWDDRYAPASRSQPATNGSHVFRGGCYFGCVVCFGADADLGSGGGLSYLH
jgi:DNA-binding LacI/PurR family transcriptional regulator